MQFYAKYIQFMYKTKNISIKANKYAIISWQLLYIMILYAGARWVTQRALVCEKNYRNIQR